MKTETIAELLDRHSVPVTECGCIIWMGRVHGGSGYGKMRIDGEDGFSAHRVSWEEANGRPVPPNMLVCHTCDMPLCINPQHLFLGTNQDNCDDKIAKGRAVNVRGESITLSKLTQKQVSEIRKSTLSNAELGRLYGVCRSTVRRARLEMTWKHVVRG